LNNDNEDDEDITWMTEEQVQALVVSNNGVLFPISYTDTDANSKKLFLASLHNAERSLSKLWIDEDFHISEENIKVSVERVSDFSSDIFEVMTSSNNKVLFESELKERYEFWQCTDGDDICNGVFIGYSEVELL